MKNQILSYSILLLIVIATPLVLSAEGLESKLSGRIIIEVEKSGEAWYVNPVDEKLYYLGRPSDAFDIMRNLGLGISRWDVEKFKDHYPERLSGRILIQVDAHGRAAYINPLDLRPYSLGTPKEAFSVMRELALGISDADFQKIDESKKVGGITTGDKVTNVEYDTLLKEIDNLIQKNRTGDFYLDNYIEYLEGYRFDLEEARNKIKLLDSSTSYKLGIITELYRDIDEREEYYKDIEITFQGYKEPIISPVRTTDWKEVSDHSGNFQINVPNHWRCSYNVNNLLGCNNQLGSEGEARVELDSYATDYEEWHRIKSSSRDYENIDDSRFGESYIYKNTQARNNNGYYLRSDKRYYYYINNQAVAVWLVYNPNNANDVNVLETIVDSLGEE